MIEFQVGGRKTGKTTLLLEWLTDAPLEEKRICVFHNLAIAGVAFKKAVEMNLNVEASQFVSVEQFRRGTMRALKNVVLGVDDLDLIISRFFDGYPVGRVTATGKDILHNDN